MKQCTLVVEGCPNKCGSTIERRAMQNHLDNECMNKRKSTNSLPLTNHSKPATNPQATTDLEHHETQHQVTMYFLEVIMFESEYNESAHMWKCHLQTLVAQSQKLQHWFIHVMKFSLS
jgi:hypothetical protein